jgi:hypothetical protein
LKDVHGAELSAIKREYYKICLGLVDDFAKAEGLARLGQKASARGGVSTRTAVMGLFGMMNWLYTWYNPRIDSDAETVARQISDIFLQGVRCEKTSTWRPSPIANDNGNGNGKVGATPGKRTRKRS